MDGVHGNIVVVAVSLINIVSLFVFALRNRFADVVRLEDFVLIERERILNRDVLDVVGSVFNLSYGRVVRILTIIERPSGHP